MAREMPAPIGLRKIAQAAGTPDPVEFLRSVLAAHTSPTEAAASLLVSENTLRRWRRAVGL